MSTHDLVLWLLDLIRNAPEPIAAAAGQTFEEAIELVVRGRRFRIRVEAIG